MTLDACPREEQTVHAVLSGMWPGGSDPDLVAHAAVCDVCSEVVQVATVLRADQDAAWREVHLPAAGQVWWRSAVRARLERSHAATQPMTWLHGLTGAVAVGLALALIGMAWPSIAIAAGWGKTFVAALIPETQIATALVAALRQSFIVALAAGACLVLAPLALYFALSDD